MGRLAQRLDAAGREGRGDQLAQAGVVGRLEPEETPALGIPEGLPARIERRNTDLLGFQNVPEIATEPLVPKAAADVFVPGHEPPLPLRLVEDPALLPHPVQHRVGIREKAWIRGVEGNCLGSRQGPNHTAHPAVLLPWQGAAGVSIAPDE